MQSDTVENVNRKSVILEYIATSDNIVKRDKEELIDDFIMIAGYSSEEAELAAQKVLEEDDKPLF